MALCTVSKCGTGCLACNFILGQCLVCDNLSSFFEDGQGGCFQQNLEKCLTPSPTGTCLLCEKNLFLNTQSGQCEEVGKAFTIENCAFYDSSQNCQECESGFYLKSGRCREVLVSILHCLGYKPETPEVCLKCKPGQILNLNGTACEAISNPANCAVYNYLDCAGCAESFFYQSNAYVDSMLEDRSVLSRYLADVQNGLYDSKLSQFCQLKKVKNCKELLFDSSCFVCEDGFFRNDEGGCDKFPDQPLRHCETYKGEGLCKKCAKGYYLENNLCKNVSDVEFCPDYQVSSDLCAACLDTHYLQTNNTCAPRVKSLNDSKCEILTVSEDSCDQCAAAHLKNSAGKCVSGISDCESYSGNVNDGSLACAQCKPTYFFNASQKWCEQPLDYANSPCLKYGDSKNECRECKFGYYLDGSCQPHTELDPYCRVSSNENANECLECQNRFACFSNSKVCSPVTSPNSNCLKWRWATECEQCVPKYQAPDCREIPVEENCAFKEEGASECSTCREGYFKNDQPPGGASRPWTSRSTPAPTTPCRATRALCAASLASRAPSSWKSRTSSAACSDSATPTSPTARWSSRALPPTPA